MIYGIRGMVAFVLVSDAPTAICSPLTDGVGQMAKIYRTSNFDYPLQHTKSGEYWVKSGEIIRVCMEVRFIFRPNIKTVESETMSLNFS